jgi:phage terminase large subunit
VITIPNNWSPRGYQLEPLTYLSDGGKRVALIWHRRSGKDSMALNWTAIAAHQKIGTYWHLLPTAKQARKVIWEAINPDSGMRLIDQVFPKEIRKEGNEGKREDEMLLRLGCGSNWQLAGSDNYNALVGSNVLGVVFSEWSLCDPRAWDYIRPILAENGGWAIFIYTPRGKNHGYDMYKMAADNPDWFCSIKTINDTKRSDGTPVISPVILDEERRAGMAPELIEQEYFCSFEAPLVGAYYATQMAEMLSEGRIKSVPYDRGLPVETWWDLGMDDATTIGFVQRLKNEIRCIDYYENSGEDLAHYVNVVQKKKYNYGNHWFPHDVKVRELGTGKSREEVLKNLGMKVNLAPNMSLMEGIEATRRMLPQVWMDKVKCDRWIEALRSYRKEYDEVREVYQMRPVHDWASHAADMTRYGALSRGPRERAGPSLQPKIKVL